MRKHFSKIKNSGFTLIETLVALSIFSISILGLMSVLSDGVASTVYAKKKITAAYLAQEGVEYVRNLRDTYVLYSATGQIGWNEFNAKMVASGASCHQLDGCYLDDRNLNFTDQTMAMTDIDLIACVVNCVSLLYDDTTGKYNYIIGTNSGFIRKIKVEIISSNETKISSTVFWEEGSGTYNMTFSESLFNWVE